MLRMHVLGIFGLLLLAACGSAQRTYGPDGKEAYILQCKGGRYACAKQAGDICGSRGYQELDPGGRAIPPQTPLGIFSEMMITCRQSSGTIYGGESHPPPQSGGETASKLLNQSK